MEAHYRIARHPDVSRARAMTARTYSTIEGAFADMGDGVVFTPDGEIVAFHERHWWLIARRGNTRMTNVGA